MSTMSIEIEASPRQVFEVLADGWTYSNWVVGTSHIRAVDADWPAPHAVLHHAVGAWPMMTRDQTVVEAVEPDVELVLMARGSPLGAARVQLRLEPCDIGCRVTMVETPESGPAKWLHNSLQDSLLDRRNRESLRRLQATVERFTSPPE